MSRYVFHRSADRDAEGTEFADVSGARVQAVILAGETLRESPEKLWVGKEVRVEVTDADGRPLFDVVTQLVERAEPACQ